MAKRHLEEVKENIDAITKTKENDQRLQKGKFIYKNKFVTKGI
jgi:hypothetical protein